MKPVRLSRHARENMVYRGATEEEIVLAIRQAEWQPAERGRFDSRKEFPFGRDWNGRRCTSKQVRPVFVDEPAEIAVVTVYVY
ncbi:DUF4258 domain-containing protein [candidate division WOR-3 bacterium]|uniref:DUF4258 domain-containing protein n=1 Tax=candidate division WOR-3 bacterium TaxID=2052148 RepID=A0A937XIY7_UNCW3|nr:DUF4258 domain-containing protein [candidate division WOR-3 bacterium]